MNKNTIAFLTLILFAACKTDEDASAAFSSWGVFNGNSTANKYSSLDQIDTSNVRELKPAWEYHTGDVDTTARSQIQCNPIIVTGNIIG